MRAIILLAALAVICPSLAKASSSCMTHRQARAEYGTSYLYWHGEGHCWSARGHRSHHHATAHHEQPQEQPRQDPAPLPEPRPVTEVWPDPPSSFPLTYRWPDVRKASPLAWFQDLQLIEGEWK